MNWYKYIKKADQLVGINNVDEIKNYEWYNGPGKIDRLLPEDKAKEEEQQFPFIAKLTPEQIQEIVKAGNSGIVYEYGNVILKYTSDRSEFRAAEHIMREQEQYNGRIPGFVEMYSATDLEIDPQDTGMYRGIYRLILERVTPIKQYDEKISHIVNFIFRAGMSLCYIQLPETYEKMIQGFMKTLKDGYYQSYSGIHIEPEETFTEEEVRDTVLKYCELQRKIHDAGGKSYDLFEPNIGVTDDGEWVLLDVGGSFG